MRWLFALALVAACGDTVQPIAMADLDREYADAICRYWSRCGLFPDVATCHRAYTGLHFPVDPNAYAGVTAGVVKYDGVKARTCIDADANQSCDLTSSSARVPPVACDGIFTGTMAENSSCASNAECTSGVCYIAICTIECCRGVCMGGAVPSRGKAGDVCGIVPCSEGTFCDINSKTCTPLMKQGAVCIGNFQCDYGLGCFGTPVMTCQPVPTIGEACPDNRCRDDGATCSGGTCAKMGLAGAPCTTRKDCSPYYQCDATGKCAEGAHVGDACTSSLDCFDAGTYCAIPNGATEGTCAQQLPDGSACQADRDCSADNCEESNSMCQPITTCT